MQEAMKVLTTRRWLPWMLVCIALGILLVVAGIWWLRTIQTVDLLGTTKIDQLTREQAARVAGIVFPASARELHTHYASFQDYIVHVRFVIDSADLEPFMKSLTISDPQISSTERPLLYSEGMPSWWKPEAAQQFQAISGTIHTATGYPDSQTILIDTSNSNGYIVYVVAFDA